MPLTLVVFYAEPDGKAPAIEWLDQVPDNVRDKLFYRVRRLEQEGYALKRPEAAPLRDGILELRVRAQRVNYRLLYFFHKGIAVVAHGCTEEGAVDSKDIDRAVKRKESYVKDPAACTFRPHRGA